MKVAARCGAVLGIDPGTRKCGYAVVAAPGITPIALGIVPTAELGATVRELVIRFGPRAIALGGGTHATAVGLQLAGLGIPVELVDERATTLLARQRYFVANPPRGWRRLVPRGMLVPPQPIDDYAAVLIAERLMERSAPAQDSL
ncbi:MAG: Holliday junction resolvase RuvX [Vulcanimicrobiaceae bacterium]